MAEKKSSLEQGLNGMIKAYKAMTKNQGSVHATLGVFVFILIFLFSVFEKRLSSTHTTDIFLFLLIIGAVIFLLKIFTVKKIVSDGAGGTKEIEESWLFQVRKWFGKNPQMLFWFYFIVVCNILYIAFHR